MGLCGERILQMGKCVEENRINLFESIPKEIQTIITTTDLDELHDSLKGKMEIYEIKENKAYKSTEERK